MSHTRYAVLSGPLSNRTLWAQLEVDEFANCLKYIGVSARHLVQGRYTTRLCIFILLVYVLIGAVIFSVALDMDGHEGWYPAWHGIHHRTASHGALAGISSRRCTSW